MIKNLLFYYYNINPSKISKQNDCFCFNYEEKSYIFKKIDSIENLNLMCYINSILLKYDIKQYYIKSNIKQDKYIIYNGAPYILLEKIGKKFIVEESIIANGNEQNIKIINKSNWKDSWINQLSFIEYGLANKKVDCSKIKSIIVLYSGLCENAIGCLNSVDNTNNQTLYFQSKNLNCEYVYPDEIIIDSSLRIISENLKETFYNNYYNIKSKTKQFNIEKYNYNERIIIFSRILVEHHFFNDLNNYFAKKNSLDIFSKYSILYKEYLKFIKEFYKKYINDSKKLEINWLERI